MSDTAKRMNAYMEAVKKLLSHEKTLGLGAGGGCLR